MVSSEHRQCGPSLSGQREWLLQPGGSIRHRDQEVGLGFHRDPSIQRCSRPRGHPTGFGACTWALSGSSGRRLGPQQTGGKVTVVAGRAYTGWQQINDVASGAHHDAWLAGWVTPRLDKGGKNLCPPAGAGLPQCTPPGFAALGFAGAASQHAIRIRVPAPEPLIAVAVAADGTVWALDPYTRCRDHRCEGPRFIRYSPKTHAFRTFVIPRHEWPGAWRSAAGRETIYPGMVSMSVARDGSVWALDQENMGGTGVRVIGLRSGHFASRWIKQGGPTLGIVVDRSSNMWLCTGHGVPEVLNTRTWSITKVHERGGGFLLADSHHRPWYVFIRGQGLAPSPLC